MTATLDPPVTPLKPALALEKAKPGIYPWELSEGRYAGRMGVYVPPTFHQRVKVIPGALYSKEDLVWTLPKAWPAVLALGAMKRETGLPMIPRPDLAAWVKEQAAHWKTLRELSSRVTGKGMTEDGFYNHQEADADWFAYGDGVTPTRGRALLSETGTGKTISILRAMQRLNLPDVNRPVLVIGPKKTLKTAWYDDITEFLPHAEPVMIRGSAAQRRKAIEQITSGDPKIGIIGWEALRTHTRFAAAPGHALKKCEKCGGPKQSPEETVSEAKCQAHDKELNKIPWGLIVGDELHRVMNNLSQTTQALWGLVRSAPDALRWGATGTLISRQVEQAWSNLHYLDAEAWPVKSTWIDYYAVTGYNMAGFLETQGIRPERDEEFQAVFSACTRRRLKAEVLDLPEMLMGGELRRECEMPAEQAKAYKSMRDEMIVKAKEGLLVAPNPMVQVGRLSMLASATGYPDPDWEKEVAAIEAENIERVKQGLPEKEIPPMKMLVKLPSGKLNEFLDDLANDFYAGDKAVAVAFSSRKVLRLLEQALVNQAPDTFTDQIGVIAGDQNDKVNEVAYYDFQHSRKKWIFYTYAAGGTGITLTAASTLIRMERPWSPILWKQGLDRVHRIGSEQHDQIRVVDYLTAGTVEEKQLTRHGENAMLLESLVNDSAKLADLLS